ncbi:MAG: hypothetical protein LKJ13_09550 [Clostridia bacterium]|jgi:hypothetical protein|nr:hypothetical protein [Clostridia bacterium]MCI1999466.1 hypothetical protein [Clostridia bacterium]MCI2014155.1 hypothetical protein [Clostridia bacterium]
MDDVTKMMLDDDIKQSRQIFSQYPNDLNRLEGLFNMLVLRYNDIIDGLSDGLEVVTVFEGEEKTTEKYKNNVRKVIQRLEMFRANNYSNEAVKEYFINEGVEGRLYDLSFEDTRKVILNMNGLGNSEREEILTNIDKIQKIVESKNTKKGKWCALKPYVIWISGKDVNIAMLILPLVLRIN